MDVKAVSDQALCDALDAVAAARAEHMRRSDDWSTVHLCPIAAKLHIDGTEYTFREVCHEGDFCDVLLGSSADNDEVVALKIARKPGDNAMLEKENNVLGYLRSIGNDNEGQTFLRAIPRLLAHLCVITPHGKRAANLLAFHETVADRSREYVSMVEVLRAYPEGLGPKSFAWMWRRVVETLTWVHTQGVVHGAIVPGNILIHPDSHHAVVLDWCYAEVISNGSHIKAGDMAFRRFYPPEVFHRHPATPAIDVYMAGILGMTLLGADCSSINPPDNMPKDWDSITFPSDVPAGIARELKLLCKLSPERRPTAVRAHQNMAAALAAEYGPPHRTEFEMPERTRSSSRERHGASRAHTRERGEN